MWGGWSMEHYQELKEVILSWERCMQNGLNKKAMPGICLEGEKFEKELDKYGQLISTFECCVNGLKELISKDLFFFH
jgi:transcriptional regulator of acetoin/glycerol metabolism